MTYRLASSLTVISVTAIVAVLTRNALIGLAGLTIWVADIMFPVFHWVLFGFPEFVSMLTASAGANAGQLYIITGVVTALMAVVWFWFILGFVRGTGTVEG